MSNDPELDDLIRHGLSRLHAIQDEPRYVTDSDVEDVADAVAWWSAYYWRVREALFDRFADDNLSADTEALVLERMGDRPSLPPGAVPISQELSDAITLILDAGMAHAATLARRDPADPSELIAAHALIEAALPNLRIQP